MEREISIILKVKGAQAAKQAVQDVFSGQTKQAVEAVNISLKKTGDNMKRVDKHSKRAGKSMDSFTKVLGRGMAALYLYNRAWMTFGRNFESGLQLERASEQFDQHVGNVTKMLPELRTATRGVIADFDLLKTSNRAFQQGIQPQQMSRTFRMATAAAQRLGLSATDAINTITNAITKQDEGALNTLGIVTSVNQAYRTQAALIAKNGGVMSKAMSIQLRQSLIMKELNRRFGNSNAIQEDGLMILERFRASWKNFRAAIGDTIGIALIPLTRVLTGVLDVTTSLLNKLNDTSGFQKFVQIAATLAGIWGASKFITGAKTLLSVLGFMGGARAAKIPKALSLTVNLIGKLGKFIFSLVPGLRNFIGALGFVAPKLAGVLSLIPGLGLAITAVTVLFDPLVSMMKLAWNSAKVFFQLLGNLDENSGLSKILKKDVEELGSFYNFVEGAAKLSLEFWAVLKGMGQGIADTFSPIGSVLDWAGTMLKSFGIDLFTVDKIAARSTSRLDAITEKVKTFTKWIGLGASAIAMFIPGFQALGLAGVGLFGGSILNDAGAFDVSQMQPPQTQSWRGNTGFIPSQPQMSTTMETPTPRAMNIDTSEDQAELLKKMSKILEKQTNIMETENQEKKVNESQQRALGNVWTRR